MLMSTVSLPEPCPGPEQAPSRPGRKRKSPGTPARGLRIIDISLVTLLLALTFLLGIFPLKDADFHWHLRTGDLIRKTGQIPYVDFYTFTRRGTPWIDLHWVFQLGISWIYELGGVPALTLAKAVITCLAVFLLVTARRRLWPVWAMVIAWLPALLVLGGRMYVRPETLSLLYLSMYLAVLCRWDRYPGLAWVLPLVQVAWVNSHGLFVLGPIILTFALVDASLRHGAFSAERSRWWRIVVPACAATGAACLFNPYGLRGAIYPLELAGTMSNPIFSRNIAELTPIPLFIQRSGLANLPLQLHLATMVIGALSFLVPIGWLAWTRLFRRQAGSTDGSLPREGGSTKGGRVKKKKASRGAVEPEEGWGISPLRLLLYVSFSALSLQATRNSHQFAAVVGAVTAWNFAQWIAALRPEASGALLDQGAATGLGPRLLAGLAVAVVMLWVGSGLFYWMTGEGRTIGWGEEPLWFPHAAVKFAGTEGMSDRFLSFHNGHASLFEYYHSPERENGPGRTVYTDPRLEIAGAELFDQYQKLGDRIGGDNPSWEEDLDRLGQPTVMADHEHSARIGARLLASRHWKCVWFDPIVSVFVHTTYADVIMKYAVDFGARHFRTAPADGPDGLRSLRAAARGLWSYMSFLADRPDVARPLSWLGLDYARRIVETDPESPDGWKLEGQIELAREPPSQPSPRFRMPFDPVIDLGIVRATYAFRRASDLAPRDFLTLMGLLSVFQARQMDEAMLPVYDRLVDLQPINRYQRAIIAQAQLARRELCLKLGPPPPDWKNLGELDQIVTEQLDKGRATTAAEILERAYPAEKAAWDVLDRLATLRLHLGEPERARDLWRRARAAPQPAVRDARVAATYLAEGQLEPARQAYEQALAADPTLFEARYGLAVLEQDAGRAASAHENALAAIEAAPTDLARAAARALASAVSRFAREEASRRVSWNRAPAPAGANAQGPTNSSHGGMP
jgi:tetratricopeptide (TPR) repeat protein